MRKFNQETNCYKTFLQATDLTLLSDRLSDWKRERGKEGRREEGKDFQDGHTVWVSGVCTATIYWVSPIYQGFFYILYISSSYNYLNYGLTSQ